MLVQSRSIGDFRSEAWLDHSQGLERQGRLLRRTSEPPAQEFAQPIKRTRSLCSMVAAVLEHAANGGDASVGGSASLAAPAPSDSGSPTRTTHTCIPAPSMRPAPSAPAAAPKSPPPAAATNGAAAMHPVASGRSIGSGWTATLPVVLSDHGSSTNSLISLESSDVAGRPSLPLSASAVATALAAAMAPQQAGAPPPSPPQQQQGKAGAQPSSVPMSPLPPQPTISYLPTVGSASSLQHGHAGALVSGFLPGGGGAQAGFLFRTYSDASDLGNGGGSGNAALFHVDLPRGYSPPPLFPAGSLPPMAAPSPPPTQGALPVNGIGGNGDGAAPGLRPLRTAAAGLGATGGAPATSVALDVSAGFAAPPRHVAAAAPVTADAWGSTRLGPGHAPVFAAAAAAFGAAAPAFRANTAAAAAAPGWGRAMGASGFGGGGTNGSAASLSDPSGPLLPILSASPSPHVGTEAWDFARRAAAEREGRKGSGSSSLGRRRSSIEATMPWRARVEAAIAEAEDAGPDAEDAGTLNGQQLAAELNALERAHYERQQQPSGQRQHRSLDAALGHPSGRGQQGEETAAADQEGDLLRFEGPSGESPTSLSAPDRHNRSSLESEGDGGSLCTQRRARLSGSGSGSECARSVDSAGAPVVPGSGPRFGRPRRSGAGQCESGYYSRQGQGDAAFELFVRLNRARQTLDFSKRQAQEFSQLDRAELSVWEALDLLQELREYEAGLAAPSEELDPLLPLKDHALQVAELCRLAFPDKEWLALVGLIHGLGKLLAHPAFGSQPQWAVAGETYPLGCRFAPQIGHAEFFCANPDRRRRCFATPNGVYRPGCGLKEVYMSWGAPEYLYLVLALNQVALPDEALFIIRYQKFYSLTRAGGAYRAFLTPEDEALLPLLSAFQRLAVYRRIELPPEALRGQELTDYYSALIEKYIGPERLFW